LSGEIVLLRNFKFLILVVVFLTFEYTPILARIIDVPSDSSTIQSGINGASDGDTVLVARGHYYERINFYGKAILVTSNFIFDNDTTTIASTIIDADTLVLGVADTGSVVVFISGEDSTSVIQGFTMQNGIGIAANYDMRPGGGIYCHSSSPTIKNNILIGNVAHNAAGGAIFCGSNTTPIITHNVITGNSSNQGGGICCALSSPIISNNTLSDNHAAYEGGGIACHYYSYPTIHYNIITGNSCDGRGGGIDLWWQCGGQISNNLIADNLAQNGGGIGCHESSPIIKNNTISRNYASSSCGGILCYYKSSPLITNNVISSNLQGWGIYCEWESNPAILHNNVWDNLDGNFIDCPAGVGDTSWGTNINGIPCDSFYNIIRDPLFVDTLNDFRLQEGSPCIDAGDNSVAPNSDLDGNARVVDGNEDDSAVVDMGAYKYQPSIGIKDEEASLAVSDFVLSQNYPNPFNPQTRIEYFLPRPAQVTLAIYNILGQKVKTLIDESHTAGTKSVTWDGKDPEGRLVASGIYFYKLETADYVDSKKMLLLK
jgi:hypothetical protein